MDDSDSMSCCKPTGHLLHDVDRLRNFQLASLLQDLMEILALKVLHRDELYALGLAEVINPDYVAMSYTRREQELLFETGEDFRIRSHLGTDHFQSHDSIHFAVGCFVHSSHAA